MRIINYLCLIALALMIGGCELRRTDAGIVEYFDPTPHAHKQLFRIDPEQSAVNIQVFRGGALSALGHNHIIAAQNIRGSVWRGSALHDSAFHLLLTAADLQVDPENLRKAGGEDFASQPTAADINGTRANMLGPRVLDATQHPKIEVWADGISGDGPDVTIPLTILVRGRAAKISVPARIEINDAAIIVKGKTRIRQTSLGLEPFSILMGAIAVRDELDIDYSFTAYPDAAQHSH
jgi:hypothetical protein